MCPLVPFYDMLLFPVLVSFVLSSPVITESYLLRPVVLILNTVACVVVQRFITYRVFFLCGGCWFLSCGSERASVPV